MDLPPIPRGWSLLRCDDSSASWRVAVPLRTNCSLTIRLNGKEESGGYRALASSPPVECFFSLAAYGMKRGGVLKYPGGSVFATFD